MNVTFSLKDLRKFNYFLGIEVTYPQTSGLFLSQEKYMVEILQRTEMFDANPTAISMISFSIISSKGNENFERNPTYT